MLSRLLGDDGGEGEVRRALAQAAAAFEGVKLPEHIWKDLAPELYQIDEAQYQTIQEDPLLRSRQMDSLTKLAGLADTGLSAADEAGYDQARKIGAQASRAGREATLADARARGVSGSGLEFATREIANQEGAGRAQTAALQQAADAARQRALYQQAYGSAVSAARGDDFRANQANTNIINQFNQANTQARNAANMANVDLKNNAQRDNQTGRNQTAQQNFDNSMARAGGIAGQYGQQAQAAAAAGAARTSELNQLVGAGIGAVGSYYGAKKK